MPEKESQYRILYRELKDYVNLNIDSLKLNAAEKTVRLLSTLALVAVVFIMAVLAFLFLTVALADLLALAVGTIWAYTIMAAFYILLVVLAIIFKRQLIIDPVARFITRLFLS